MAEARGVTWVPGLLQRDHADEYREDDETGHMSHRITLEKAACGLNKMLSIDEPTSSSGGGVSSEAEQPNEEDVGKAGASTSLIEARTHTSSDADVEHQSTPPRCRLQASSLTPDEREQSTPAPDADKVILKKKRPWWTQRTLRQMKRQFFAELDHVNSAPPSTSVEGANTMPLHSSRAYGEVSFLERASHEPPGVSSSNTKTTQHISNHALKTSGTPKQDVLTSEEQRQHLGKGGRIIPAPRDKGPQSQQHGQHTRKVYIFVDNSNILVGYYNYYRLHYPETEEEEESEYEVDTQEPSADIGETQGPLIRQAPQQSPAERTGVEASPWPSENREILQPKQADSAPSPSVTDAALPERGSSPHLTPHEPIQQLPSTMTYDSTWMRDGEAAAALSFIGSHAELNKAGTQSKKVTINVETDKSMALDSSHAEPTMESTRPSSSGSQGIKMVSRSEYLPQFRYPLFFRLLERGRSAVKRELVGSSPLHQKLDDAMEYGYEVRILKRVRKLSEGQLGAVPVPVKTLRYPPGQYASNNGVNASNINGNNTAVSTPSGKSSKPPVVPAKQEKRSNVKITTVPSALVCTPSGQTAPITTEVALMTAQLCTSDPSREMVATTEEPSLQRPTSANTDVIALADEPIIHISSLLIPDSRVPSQTDDSLDWPPVWSEIGLTVGDATTSSSTEAEVLDSLRLVDTIAIASDVTYCDIGNKHRDGSEHEVVSLVEESSNTPTATKTATAVAAAAATASAATTTTTTAATTTTITTATTATATTTTAAELVPSMTAASTNTGAAQDAATSEESFLRDLLGMVFGGETGASKIMPDTAESSAEAFVTTDAQSTKNKEKEKEESKKSKKSVKESRSKISKDILSSMVTIRGEQCVDELLHLKMLETLLDCEPGVMVLATGDGAPSEYGGGGFYDVVKRALDRGWLVEIFSWEEQLSGCYLELVQEYGSHALTSWPSEAGGQGTTDNSGDGQQQHRPLQPGTEGLTEGARRDVHHLNPHQHQHPHHQHQPHYVQHHLQYHNRHSAYDTRPRGQHSSFKRRGTIRVMCLDWLGEKFL
ncbi:hypothetical protein BGZ73_008869 [Actinomortierella ambigua]|nr:hypothetical protein BGZ73_008869 [Actinomortierella ambigua]